MALPDSLVEVVCSPAALHCQIKGCKEKHPDTTLHKNLVSMIVSRVPFNKGTLGAAALWERKKVQSELAAQLRDLKPRFWDGGAIADLCSAVAKHDWYA